jgi:hypothetical protein
MLKDAGYLFLATILIAAIFAAAFIALGGLSWLPF